MTEQVACVKCDEPATLWCAPDDRQDPHCAACAGRDFVECPSCGRLVQPDDVGARLLEARTWGSPAVYDECCCYCGGAGDGRERGDDDGAEYGHPADAMQGGD
jgi:hypothetical protein